MDSFVNTVWREQKGDRWEKWETVEGKEIRRRGGEAGLNGDGEMEQFCARKV